MILELPKKLHNFTIEVPRENQDNLIINGQLRDLTKEETTTIKEKYKSSMENFKQIQKLYKDVEFLTLEKDVLSKKEDKTEVVALIKDKLYPAETKLNELTENLDMSKLNEDMAKDKLELQLCLNSKNEVMKLSAQFGYGLVLDTILKDIEEGK